MALVKGSDFAALNKALITSYNETFKATTSNVADLVTVQPTNGYNQVVHSFVATMPKFRTWEGDKIVHSLKLERILVDTQKKELTVGIDVEDMMNPNVQNLIGQLSDMGQEAALLTDDMVAEFLMNGTSTDEKFENFDGLPLFSTAHPRDGLSNQSNNNTSQELTATNLQESYEQVMAYTDSTGKPLKLMPTHIIVPSALYLTAKALIENPFDASGATNTMYNSLKIVHLPELDAYPTTWYLTVTKGSTKPFMNYVLAAPVDTLLNDPSDPAFFNNDMVIYGSVARQAIAAAPWFLLQRNIA